MEPRRVGDALLIERESGTYQYELVTDGTAEARGGPAHIAGVARLHSATFLTLRQERQPGGTLARVTIDSFAVRADEPRIPPASSAELSSSAYEVTLTGEGRSERLSPTGIGCPGGSPAEGSMREVVVPLPSSLTPRQQWADSVVTLSCRDGVPITTLTTSAYSLLGREQRRGQQLLRIRRVSDMRTDGSQVRRGQAIGLSGTGTEEATLLVDASRGVLVESESRVRVELVLSGREGEIPLRQRFTQRVRLVAR